MDSYDIMVLVTWLMFTIHRKSDGGINHMVSMAFLWKCFFSKPLFIQKEKIEPKNIQQYPSAGEKLKNIKKEYNNPKIYT